MPEVEDRFTDMFRLLLLCWERINCLSLCYFGNLCGWSGSLQSSLGMFVPVNMSSLGMFTLLTRHHWYVCTCQRVIIGYVNKSSLGMFIPVDVSSLVMFTLLTRHHWVCMYLLPSHHWVCMSLLMSYHWVCMFLFMSSLSMYVPVNESSLDMYVSVYVITEYVCPC